MGGKLDAWCRAAGLTRGSVQRLVAFLAQGSASGNGREGGGGSIPSDTITSVFARSGRVTKMARATARAFAAVVVCVRGQGVGVSPTGCGIRVVGIRAFARRGKLLALQFDLADNVRNV